MNPGTDLIMHHLELLQTRASASGKSTLVVGAQRGHKATGVYDPNFGNSFKLLCKKLTP